MSLTLYAFEEASRVRDCWGGLLCAAEQISKDLEGQSRKENCVQAALCRQESAGITSLLIARE